VDSDRSGYREWESTAALDRRKIESLTNHLPAEALPRNVSGLCVWKVAEDLSECFTFTYYRSIGKKTKDPGVLHASCVIFGIQINATYIFRVGSCSGSREHDHAIFDSPAWLLVGSRGVP